MSSVEILSFIDSIASKGSERDGECADQTMPLYQTYTSCLLYSTLSNAWREHLYIYVHIQFG